VLSDEARDADALYALIEEFQEQFGVRFFSEDLAQNLKLRDMHIRQREILGTAFENLPGFYKQAQKAYAEVGVFTVAERGYVYSVRIKGKEYVLKPIQGYENEQRIAQRASDIGIGPHIVEVTHAWLAEEYVVGVPFFRAGISEQDAAPILAHVFGTLHRNQITYFDGFDDDRGHLILTERGPVLLDYGVAELSTDTARDIRRVSRYLATYTAQEIFEKHYQAVLVGETPQPKQSLRRMLGSLLRR
jgi:predicted Ser/Thr protein kinase